MTIAIRRSDRDDTADVRKVFMRSWIELCDRLGLDRSQVNPDAWVIDSTWVAIEDDAVVGFVLVEDDVVDRLYIDPDYQRRGVGAALLKAARADGATWLWVDEHSAEGRAFYEKNGFRWDGTSIPGYNFPEEPLLRYLYVGEQ